MEEPVNFWKFSGSLIKRVRNKGVGVPTVHSVPLRSSQFPGVKPLKREAGIIESLLVLESAKDFQGSRRTGGKHGMRGDERTVLARGWQAGKHLESYPLDELMKMHADVRDVCVKIYI